MSKQKNKETFWLSYSDLMTSLFFIMLVLFVICISMLSNRLGNIRLENERLMSLLQMEAHFKELSSSSDLQYVEEKKMFVAKDLIGIEIFQPLEATIKPEYIDDVDRIGKSLQELVKNLHTNNPDLSFQLVIEGNAAIPWDALRKGTYNENSISMYKLSYERALVLYLRWLNNGVNLRHYNTEVIIAGSGFSGENRDNKIEENNKRFIIQIIPKISMPKGSSTKIDE